MPRLKLNHWTDSLNTARRRPQRRKEPVSVLLCRAAMTESLESRQVMSAMSIAADVSTVTVAFASEVDATDAVFAGYHEIAATETSQQTPENQTPILDGPFREAPAAQPDETTPTASETESDLDGFADAIRKIQEQHERETEQIRRDAEQKQEAVKSAGEHEIAAVKLEAQQLEQQATQEYQNKLNQAERDAAAAMVAADQARDAAIRDAERSAASQMAQETAKRDASINREQSLAQQKINAENSNRDQAIRNEVHATDRRVQTAVANADQAMKRAEASRDAEIRDARGWYDKAVAKLPSWARKLASYLSPLVKKLESLVNSAVNAFKSAVSSIQNGLEAAKRSLLQARDRVVSGIRTAAANAVSAILSARDRLVAGIQKTFNATVSTILQAKDRLISSAKTVAVTLKDKALAARDQAVSSASRVLIQTRDSLTAGVTSTIENVGNRVASGIQQIAEKTERILSDLAVTMSEQVVGLLGHALQSQMEKAFEPMRNSLTDRFSDYSEQELTALTSEFSALALATTMRESGGEADANEPSSGMIQEVLATIGADKGFSLGPVSWNATVGNFSDGEPQTAKAVFCFYACVGGGLENGEEVLTAGGELMGARILINWYSPTKQDSHFGMEASGSIGDLANRLGVGKALPKAVFDKIDVGFTASWSPRHGFQFDVGLSSSSQAFPMTIGVNAPVYGN